MPRGKSAIKKVRSKAKKDEEGEMNVTETVVKRYRKKGKDKEKEEPAEDIQPKDMPEAEPEEAKDEMPDFARELLEDFDDEQFDKWSISVDRWTPEYTPEGIRLCKKQIKKWPGLFMGLDEITDIVQRENGGGIYFIRVCDAGNKIRKKKKIVIEGSPIASPQDFKYHKETIGEIVAKEKIKHEEERDEEDRLERERRLYERKLDLERARREFEREKRRLDRLEEIETSEGREDEGGNGDEDEDEENEREKGQRAHLRNLRARGIIPPGIDGVEETLLTHTRQSRSAEDIEHELDLKYENRALKEKLNRIEERMEAVQDTVKARPVEKSGSGFDIASLVPVIVKALDVLKPPPPQPQQADPQIGILAETMKDLVRKLDQPRGENPIDLAIKLNELIKPREEPSLVMQQMQQGNSMIMDNMREMNKTQGELTRQAVMQILEGGKEGEPDDWKTTALKKGLDTVETFGKEIVGFNKEKLKIEERKLELIDKGRIVPAGQKQIPAGKRPAQQARRQATPPQPVAKRPVAPVQPSPASPGKAVAPEPPKSEVAGVSSEKVQEIYTLANNLLQAAIQAFLKDEDPAEFAKQTLEIGGPDVTEWLLESEGISAIEGLAKEFGQEAAYGKWIAGNMLVKTWLGKWIDAVKGSYRFEGEKAGEEEPVAEPATEPVEQLKPRKRGRMEERLKPIRAPRKTAKRPVKEEKPPVAAKKKAGVKKKSKKVSEKTEKEKTA